MLDYLLSHWQGKQSLARSFWINLVALRAITFFIQGFLAPPADTDYSHIGALVFALVFVFHVILLVWQLVGVVRSAENHFSEHGTMALVWGAQLGGVLMFMLTAVYALGAIQMTHKSESGENALAQMEAMHTSRYSIAISDDGLHITIEGSIEPGISRALRKTLRQNENVRTASLNSPGGNIYEGRGLASIFHEQQIATHVHESCASACVIAFVGGKPRTADKNAAFGFHQYRIDANYTIIATDVASEQKRDEQLLLEAGVDQAFVDVVFDQPSQSMWWPPLSELVSAGFISGITSD